MPIGLFFFQFCAEASKTLSEVRVSTDKTVLYFPLKNSLSHTIGYREIHAGKEDEMKNFGLHTEGLFSCRALKVGRSDQAILVPSIQDVLNLAAQKVSGLYKPYLLFFKITILMMMFLLSISQNSSILLFRQI